MAIVCHWPEFHPAVNTTGCLVNHLNTLLWVNPTLCKIVLVLAAHDYSAGYVKFCIARGLYSRKYGIPLTIPSTRKIKPRC